MSHCQHDRVLPWFLAAAAAATAGCALCSKEAAAAELMNLDSN